MLYRSALLVIGFVSQGVEWTTEAVVEVPGTAVRLFRSYLRHLETTAGHRSRYRRLARALRAGYRELKRSRRLAGF
jgi:hypothetical protein